MFFADKLQLAQPRKTSAGYLLTRARSSRSGIQDYTGSEVGRPDMARVAVYRPESEVFDQAAIASFIGKPITDDHPSVPVTAANWTDYAKGFVGGALRDGDYLAFDLAVMDQSTIDAIESGKRQLSCGYSSQLDFTAGVAPDGQRFDAVMRNLRGNHISIVSQARAGPLARIGDVALCDRAPSHFQIDVKQPDEPKSIDEALAAEFARQAGSPDNVSNWLAKQSPKDLDAIVAEIAQRFVHAHAGKGIAGHFGE